MIRKFLLFFLTIILNFNFSSRADEGMWLPLLLQKNYEAMQKLGLKLTPEQIYSMNNSSLKDAIVNFGNFCTGEVISPDGLILTNHHCGYDAIQTHSTVENDYLTLGFWAANREKELPNQGLTVTFLVYMKDVTEEILYEIRHLSPDQMQALAEEKAAALAEQSVEGTHYHAEVKDFFEGNQYFLFVYETYNDVRLVGAPPSSIGKFGGDTDNWMWPRHTGDFSLFRVYTGPDGKPAEYSPANIPLKPRHHLPVSLAGVQKNDFTMVLGYPGNTERYLTSEGVSLAYEITNPTRVKIREKRLALMQEDMDASPQVRIKYATKYAQVSNYHKYFIGQNQGLRRLNVIERKRAEEKRFTDWVEKDPDRKRIYGNVLPDYQKIYSDYRKVKPAYTYLEEAAFGTEILLLAYRFNTLQQLMKANAGSEEINKTIDGLKKLTSDHFKDYNAPTDKRIFAALLKMYYDDINKAQHPSIFAEVEKKHKGNFTRFADDVFLKSIFASSNRTENFLKNPDLKVLEKDPAFRTMISVIGDFRRKLGPTLASVYSRMGANDHLYHRAILDMRSEEFLYPDANFTMRLTYGTVQDYYPRDAVYFNYYTTIEGIIEKADTVNEEFFVPQKLKELYHRKDYGRYGMNGTMPVCFISNNDITGGNSGSPVINAEGHLIGCAFDGNWEAMSGDIIFEPELQRCISVDIRYILFIIDKFAGASHLIEEMTLVESKEEVKEPVKIEIEPIQNKRLQSTY